MLGCRLAIRAAHEGLAEAETDGELAHAGVRREIGDDLIERHIEIDELK